MITNNFWDLGESLNDLAHQLSKWSQKTFGNDNKRGPEGAMRHLKLEVEEVLKQPDDVLEYADCFMLIVDAARRAGFDMPELLDAAHKKLEENKKREWGPVNKLGISTHKKKRGRPKKT